MSIIIIIIYAATSWFICLLCDAAGWVLIDKTKYPISIAPGGLAPLKVRLDGAGTDPNGFAIAKSVAVELTATDACNTAIARPATLPTTELKVLLFLNFFN